MATKSGLLIKLATMKSKQIINSLLIVFSFFLFQGCKEDDSDLEYLNNIEIPSNLGLLVQLSQDNSGTVFLTPSGTSASLFIINYGDGSESVEVMPGNSINHTYNEGSYTATLTAKNLNGEVSQPFEAPVVVSFLPPQNLVINVSPVAGDNFSISLSATADLAVGFEVYFGDVPDEEPTPLMIGESVVHTYPEVGLYDITVVALSGGAESSSLTQTITIENPVLLPLDFESETLEYSLINFGGGISTIITNPDPAGINTSSKVVEFLKESGAEIFAGTVIELGGNIDFSDLQAIKMDVWSPLAGSTVKLKIENGTDPNISAEIDAITTSTNSWETLYFDFTNADLTQEYAKVVVFFDFGNVGNDDVFYYDNIDLAIAPSASVSLPIDFENSNLNYQITGFEGAESSIELNPDPSGVNTTSTVIKTIKTEGAQFYAGTSITVDTPIVLNTTERIRIKTWSPKAGIPVRLKLENSSGDFIELDVNTTVTNQWEELVWDFAGMNTAPEFTTVVIFFEFIVDLPGDGTTYYFDEIDYAN